MAPIVQPQWAFTVTIRKRFDLDEPTNAKRAAAMIKYLLERGTYFDIVSIEPADTLFTQGGTNA